MISNNIVIGFLGFDAVGALRTWEADSILLIKMMGDILSNALTRKRVEEGMRLIERRNRALIEKAPDGISLLDATGTFIYGSPAATIIFGYNQEEMLGNQAARWIHPDEQKKMHENFVRLATGPANASFTAEFRFLHKDGFYRWVEGTFANLLAEPGVHAIVNNFRDITERKQASEKLSRSQANLEAAQATAHLGSWESDLVNGTGLTWSKEMYRLFHFDPALGVPDFNEILKLVHPDDRQLLLNAYQQASECDHTITIEYRIYPGGSDMKFFQTAIRVEKNEKGQLLRQVGTVLDVTENRLARLTLQERVKELTCLFQVNCLLENRHLALDVVCNTILTYIPPAMQYLEQTKARMFLDGNHYSLSVPDESLTHCLEAPIEIGGVTRGRLIVCYSSDVPFIIPEEQNLLANITRMLGLWIEQREAETAMRAAQQALESLNHELEQRVEERTMEVRKHRDTLFSTNLALEKANKLKDEFMASMSHELRTPLTGILGLSEALQMEVYGSMSESQSKALKHIETSGRHLLELINDILDLSKIEADKLEIQFETCDVATVCQASLQLIRGMAQKKGQKVSFSSNPSTASVQADPRRFKQMLVNLLSNAVKFTPNGGTLGLEVVGDEENRKINLTVWDRGIGITPEDQQKLFKPFTQIDSSLSRQQAGTGLGLSLVARLAELHGGSVLVESIINQGSRFTLILPWDIRPEPEAKQEENLQIHRCLLIEDDELHRQQIGDYLQRLGVECIFHNQGNSSLDTALQTRPDVILLDLNLPDISGEQVLRKIKSHTVTSKMVVIISSVSEDRRKYQELGAAGYLVKPFTVDDLKNELLRVQHLAPLPEAGQAAEEKGTVLLADDDTMNLETMSDFLRAKGYQVIQASSGKELIELAHTTQPDIILTDIQMPGMDGLQAIRQLRASQTPNLVSVPIVAITALAMPGDEQMCLAAGANRYISKPVSLTKLISLVSEMMKNTR